MQRKFQRWTRDVHLASALLLAGTLFAYTLTGFVVVHGSWVPDTEERTSTSVAFDYHASQLDEPSTWKTTADRAAAQLQLGGRIQLPKQLDAKGRLKIRFSRLSQLATLWLGPGKGNAVLEHQHLGLSSTLSNVHKLHGSAGGTGYLLASLWIDLTAIAMTLFALTGVALWFWLKADRLGAAILTASTLSTLAAVAALTFSP